MARSLSVETQAEGTRPAPGATPKSSTAAASARSGADRAILGGHAKPRRSRSYAYRGPVTGRAQARPSSAAPTRATVPVDEEHDTRREVSGPSPAASILRPSSAAPRLYITSLDSSITSRGTNSRSGIEEKMAAAARAAAADAELRDLLEHGPKEASRTGHVNPKHYNDNILLYDSFLRPHVSDKGGYDPRSLSLDHTRFPLSSNAGRAVRRETASGLAMTLTAAAAKRARGSMLTSVSAAAAGSFRSTSSAAAAGSFRSTSSAAEGSLSSSAAAAGSFSSSSSSSSAATTTAGSSSVMASGGVSRNAMSGSHSASHNNQVEVEPEDLAAAAELAPPLCLKCGQLADKEVTRYRRVRAVGFKHIFDKAQQQHGQRERDLRLRQVMSVWRAHTRTRKLRDQEVRSLYSLRRECLLRRYYTQWLQGALRQASRRQQSRLADKLSEREREIRKLTVQLELALHVQPAAIAAVRSS